MKLYKAGTLIPESWYTLTFKDGYSLADYPDMKFQFIKDANVLEINDMRYVQAVRPVRNQSDKARDRRDVIGITGVENAHLDFPCVMLTYEHDMMKIIWDDLNKRLNKLLLAMRKSYKRLPLRAA